MYLANDILTNNKWLKRRRQMRYYNYKTPDEKGTSVQKE